MHASEGAGAPRAHRRQIVDSPIGVLRGQRDRRAPRAVRIVRGLAKRRGRRRRPATATLPSR